MERLDFPANRRNRDPIADVLARWLPAQARVLEVASGSGQHAVAFCARMPGVVWQPTDLDPRHLQSIEAWRRTVPDERNLLPALPLDVTVAPWPGAPYDAVVAINLLHIAPFEVTKLLFRHAVTAVAPHGQMILYGPFHRDGVATAPSNAAFDEDLRLRDPRWGVRDLADVSAAAGEAGWELVETQAMPANNLMLRIARAGARPS